MPLDHLVENNYFWHLLCQEPEEELIFTLLMKTSGWKSKRQGILIVLVVLDEI